MIYYRGITGSGVTGDGKLPDQELHEEVLHGQECQEMVYSDLELHEESRCMYIT